MFCFHRSAQTCETKILDMRTEWQKSASAEQVYEDRDRSTGKVKWALLSTSCSARIPKPVRVHGSTHRTMRTRRS
jgi:hypothetical protein